MTRHLLETLGVNGRRKNSAGETCWHVIAARDDVLLANVFRSAKVAPDDLNGEGKTPLHVASSGQMASTLIALGCGVDARDENGQTALHLAAMLGRHEVLTALIEAGVDVGVKDNIGNDALYVAAASGNNVAVAVLLTAGCSVHRYEFYVFLTHDCFVLFITSVFGFLFFFVYLF